MLRIMRLTTGIVAAALRGMRKRAGGRFLTAKPPKDGSRSEVAWPAIMVPTGAAWTGDAHPFCPSPGDEVEAWSTYASAWYPAVVVASSDNPWDPIVVRLACNGANVHDKLRRDLVRPLRQRARRN